MIVFSHHKKGYIAVSMPNHPFARKGGSVLEHRLVMEKKIGRYLTPIERVHHIDGDTINNHPDNLELFDNPSKHNAHPHNRYQGWFPKGVAPWNKTFTTKVCEICQKVYELSPRASEKRRTCSKKCFGKFMSHKMRGNLFAKK